MDNIALNGAGCTVNAGDSSKIPAEQKGRPQWVVWRSEDRGNGPTKVPYSPRTGGKASSADIGTWATYPEALEALEAGGYSGIGFVFSEADPYTGIDLDKCRDAETGELTPEARAVVESFRGAYIEASPSGTGVHIIVKGEVPGARKRRGNFEIYSKGRFFTVTGDCYGDAPETIPAMQDALNAFYGERIGDETRQDPATPAPATNGAGPSDEAVIEKLLAESTDKGCRLHSGDTSGYDSDSEADLAYLSKLAFYTQDPDQLERIWCGSGLARKKLNRAGYRRDTITKALNRVGEVYEWHPRTFDVRTSPERAGGEPEGFFQAYDEMPSFPVDAMPVKTRAFIRETAAAIDCPVELVALPTLATLSASLGHAREVQVKRGHTQTASIYAVGIAESGSGKTPAASIAQKPLKEIQRENGEDYARRKEIHEDEMRAHAVKVKWARKEETPEPKAPPKPVFERTWVDNATIEALAGLLEANPYGLALFQDELTGWLGGFDQYKAKGKGDTRQQFIRVWGGDTVTIDRKGDEEPIIIQRPYVTIYGSIQPRLIEEMGADREDGFINRFLMAYPEPHIARETDNEISYAAEKSYEELVRQLYMLRPTNSSDSSDSFSGRTEKLPALVTFTRQAREVYKEHANRLAASAAEPGTPKTLRETYPKLRAYLARLSLLVATCRELEVGGDMEITPADVLAAARLLGYFEAAARKAFHELASSDTETKNAFELSSLLRREGGHLVATAEEFRAALPSAPDTPEGTSKLLRKIARSTPRIILEDGWRGKERVLKISLLEKLSELLELLVSLPPPKIRRPVRMPARTT